MQRFEVRVLGRLTVGLAKGPCRALDQLRPPLSDLIRVDIEALCKLRKRLIAFDGRDRHLGFERRRVVAASSSSHVCSLCWAVLRPTVSRVSTYRTVRLSGATSVFTQITTDTHRRDARRATQQRVDGFLERV